jgi:hypothetical protein
MPGIVQFASATTPIPPPPETRGVFCHLEAPLDPAPPFLFRNFEEARHIQKHFCCTPGRLLPTEAGEGSISSNQRPSRGVTHNMRDLRSSPKLVFLLLAFLVATVQAQEDPTPPPSAPTDPPPPAPTTPPPPAPTTPPPPAPITPPTSPPTPKPTPTWKPTPAGTKPGGGAFPTPAPGPSGDTSASEKKKNHGSAALVLGLGALFGCVAAGVGIFVYNRGQDKERSSSLNGSLLRADHDYIEMGNMQHSGPPVQAQSQEYMPHTQEATLTR